VPAHDGLGANKERIPALARQNPTCCGEQCAVPHSVNGALHLTTQDRNLVTKDEDLNLGLLVRAITRGKDAEQATKQ